MKTTIGLALATVAVLALVVAFIWFTAATSLACGDRGGDIYWGTMFRHVCIGHDGQVLP